MPTYSEVYQTSRLQDTPIPEAISRQVSNSFEDDRRLRIVDVGSGIGRVAVPLAREVSEVVCLDRDRDALEILGRKTPTIPAVRADVEKTLPLETNTFDVAVLSHVLHWLDRPERALSEIYRVLSRDGILLLFLYAQEDLAGRIKNRLGGRRLTDVHRELVPSVSEIRSSLETVGFNDVDVTKIPYERTYEKDDLRQVLAEVATTPLREFRRRYGPKDYAALRERIERRLEDQCCGATVKEREVECCIRAKKGQDGGEIETSRTGGESV